MLVKFQNRPVSKPFNNFMDDFFFNSPSIYRDDRPMKKSTPVNIRETENGYELDLVAPGFNKEDFKINLEKDLLTISAEVKSPAENSEVKQKEVRKEFSLQSFTRSFTLTDKIEAGGIVAKYLNGILTVNLPKKADVKVEVKQIEIQ